MLIGLMQLKFFAAHRWAPGSPINSDGHAKTVILYVLHMMAIGWSAWVERFLMENIKRQFMIL
jgi:hypothetical protein